MWTFKHLDNYLKLFQDHVWIFSLYIIVILLYFGFPLISEFSYSIRLFLIKNTEIIFKKIFFPIIFKIITNFT